MEATNFISPQKDTQKGDTQRDAESNPWGASEAYEAFAKPKIAKLLSLMKMDRIYTRAVGDQLFYKDQEGQLQSVVDFLGGYGSLILGHNEEQLRIAATEFFEQRFPIHAQASIRAGVSELSQKLNQALVQECEFEISSSYLTHLTNSGAETVEAALKHALMRWRVHKEKLLFAMQLRQLEKPDPRVAEDLIQLQQAEPQIWAFERAYHGKTAGAVAVTENQAFRSMYPGVVFARQFLPTEISDSEIDARISASEIIPGFSTLAAIIYEPIQCEGGIFSLTGSLQKKLFQVTRRTETSLIVDEIQTGFFRCGRWALHSENGFLADVICFGKSLGGGIAKIGACLIRKDQFVEDFSLSHSSTFAEDEFSTHVALKTVDILNFRMQEIQERARKVEVALRDMLTSLQTRYPDLIAEFRGRGFLFGIEWNMGMTTDHSFFLKALFQSGYGSYFLSSYLLNRHAVRVGVSLSASSVLRLEPCAFIRSSSIQNLSQGLNDLCALLSRGDSEALTAHLWSESPFSQALSLKKSPHLKVSSEIPKVGFCSHLISNSHMTLIDPVFKNRSERDLQKILQTSGLLEMHATLEEQQLEDKNRNPIHFLMYGLFNTSAQFEKSLRQGDSAMFERVQNMVWQLEDLGARYIGLGQYTSIVSRNGLLLQAKPSTILTTGNSLTSAFSYLALQKVLADKGLDLKDLTVGILGVTGNICQVMAQILADHCAQMKLFYRESVQQNKRFKLAVDGVFQNSNIKSENLQATDDYRHLRDCDVIICATNSVQPFLISELLKQNAIIIDISVPTNVHADVLRNRPDVVAMQGGLVQLPGSQPVASTCSPTPIGNTYACLAETLMMGFLKVQTPYSIGPLTKAGVLRALEDSRKVGYELGQLRQVIEI